MMDSPHEPLNDPHRAQHDAYRIALFYCYVTISDPAAYVEEQRKLCIGNQLLGRIRVSPEGLNGVLSGLLENLQAYHESIEVQLALVDSLDVKYCLLRTDLSVDSQLFTSLSVKVTREVVSLFEPTREEQASKQRSKRKNRRAPQDHSETSHPSSPNSPSHPQLRHHSPAQHLSPEEWNEFLHNAETKNVLLLDARNIYESNVGYFAAPGVSTLLTNTRKYSDLPQIMQEYRTEIQKHDDVLMYCTGGVRCERASVLLQALLEEEEETNENGAKKKPNIYQLHGGIQRYLERYATHQGDAKNVTNDDCLFRGKNFCFDPRRTDPLTSNREAIVGVCELCHKAHDDYDNGKAPSEENEVRCVKCRILVLVCDECRSTVRVWGQATTDGKKPELYCGGFTKGCLAGASSVSIVSSDPGS